MARKLLVVVPGVSDTGMLTQTAELLVARHHFSDWLELDWKAQYGPVGPEGFAGKAFERSTADGLQKLNELVLSPEWRNVPTALVGYSAGALVVHRFGLQNLVPEWVFAAAHLSDPGQPRLNGSPFDKFGIVGDLRKSHRYAEKWWGDPKDVICNCEQDSPLRTFADLSEGFSLADPAFWTKSLAAKLQAQALQKVAFFWNDPLRQAALYQRAAQDAWGYAVGGDHTSYGERTVPEGGPTYLLDLHNWLQAQSWKYGEVV